MSNNGTPLFEASNLKIERAIQHLQELEMVLFTHANNHPPQATFKKNEQGSVTHIHVVTKSPPKMVGAIVGDIVHNLRAALDLMAVELVSLTPNANTNGVYFPFCDVADDLNLMIKKRNFHRAGQDAVELLVTLRPYKGGNAALRALHDLDIQDKHHTLIPNAAIMTGPQVTADTSDFPNIKIVPVEGSVPSVDIVFPDDSPLAGGEMVKELYGLLELTKGILESFSSLVAARAG
jgi:hypothetical protein